jgi:hypothetical protein
MAAQLAVSLVDLWGQMWVELLADSKGFVTVGLLASTWVDLSADLRAPQMVGLMASMWVDLLVEQ